ncbi:hypothetical protein M9H77_04092 [Catharanthus roseus]|uniref:Uncharacterized protein n=1 Tax=Catharanthus roseus TaxID=4058 RepID=A0ACC0CD41_CATRO|nr:hypothetical protein M9H77_04092 [Catharanthus roseus]
MTTYENWQSFVHDGRHNHAIGVYNHGHTQVAKLTEEQLILTEQFRKIHVPPLSFVFHVQYVIVGGCRDDSDRMSKHLYFSSAVSTGNEQDGSAHDSCMIITYRESGLMPVIEEVLSRGISYAM